jgi:hypothetical protein
MTPSVSSRRYAAMTRSSSYLRIEERELEAGELTNLTVIERLVTIWL